MRKADIAAIAVAGAIVLAPRAARGHFVLRAPASWAEQDGQGNPWHDDPRMTKGRAERNPLGGIMVAAAASFLWDAYQLVGNGQADGDVLLRAIGAVTFGVLYWRRSRFAADVVFLFWTAFAPAHLLLMRLDFAQPMLQSSIGIWLALWAATLGFLWWLRGRYARWHGLQVKRTVSSPTAIT